MYSVCVANIVCHGVWEPCLSWPASQPANGLLLLNSALATDASSKWYAGMLLDGHAPSQAVHTHTHTLTCTHTHTYAHSLTHTYMHAHIYHIHIHYQN